VESRDAILVAVWNKGRIRNRLGRFLFLLQLNATNEIVIRNISNSSSADIFEVTSHTLIDSDSSAQIINNCMQ